MRLLTMKKILLVVPFIEAASVMGHASWVIRFSYPTHDS